MNGLPSNMDAIMSIAKKYDLLVLEDACQADGGVYKGKRLGSIGDAGAFSFNHYKIITCGEGGAFVTDNQQIFEKGLIHHDGGATFRNYASKLETPVFAGWNFRINEILSAILNIQLNRLEGILTTLRSEKQVLMDALKNEPAFTLNPINDPQGDCATTLSLLFDTPEMTTQFLAALEELGVEDASTPIDSDLHVYSNWKPVLKRKGAHHPGRDAYQLAEHPVNYISDMCAKSLDILARTAFIPTRIDRSPAALEDLIDHIHNAARMID
jgi:dTDP-4-amino-4,6-dideoxygalactose transaminase